jgi:putative oxidoreductase
MRLGAIGAVLYLVIATYLGHHFSLGFIWAGQGGGWEFATMWIILILCFAITGAHQFSIDQRLEDKFKLPKWVKALM